MGGGIRRLLTMHGGGIRQTFLGDRGRGNGPKGEPSDAGISDSNGEECESIIGERVLAIKERYYSKTAHESVAGPHNPLFGSGGHVKPFCCSMGHVRVAQVE